MMSTSRSLRRVAKALAALIVIASACSCCIALSVAGTADEFEEVDYPQIVTDTEVSIDVSSLPRRPTVTDWSSIAAQVLFDHGWDQSLNLTMVGGLLACDPDAELDKLKLHFADSYFVGIIPHLKTASVSVDRATSTASLLITDQALRWRHSTIDLGKMQIGLYEAIQIADRNGGREFRESVAGKCELSTSLSDHEWTISYKEFGQPNWSDLTVQVSSRTGKARQLPR